MKMNKTMLAAVLAFGAISSGAHAVDAGHGTVTFNGSIVDAPCSIDPEAMDQTVELGSVSNVTLTNGGNSDPKPFYILLEKCSLATAQTVTTTFDGAASNDGSMLGMTGDAKGAGIVITDGNNNVIKLGEPSQGQAISAGATNASLAFSAYLKGDGADVVPGKFQSVANFILNYK